MSMYTADTTYKTHFGTSTKWILCRMNLVGEIGPNPGMFILDVLWQIEN